MITIRFPRLSAAVLTLGLALSVGAQSSDKAKPSDPSKIRSAQSAQLSPAVLQDLRQQLAGKLTTAQIENLLSNLASMNFHQVDALARGPTSQLERLIPGVRTGKVSAGSGTASSLDHQGVRTSGKAGSPASQAGTVGQAPFKGGFAGGRQGQLSDCGQACGSGTQDRNSKDETQDTENLAKAPIDTNKSDGSSGFEIRIYQDGSFTITDKSNGQREVWGKDGQPATKSPKWTADKTPVPDEDGGSRSGGVTRDEWRTLMGMIGARGGRLDKGNGTAAGGLKAPTRTTAGTPVETTSTGVVDLVQLQEIIRVSIEKLGPKLN